MSSANCNLIKYFKLVSDGNPNMVDSLFVPQSCIIYQNEIGRLVRENRKLFLSQKMYHTFKGMMWSHLSRIKQGNPKEGRRELVKKYGFDLFINGHEHNQSYAYTSSLNVPLTKMNIFYS